MLAVVAALSFANAWPDAVVLDDKFFVNKKHLPDWTEPAELFRGDVWRTAGASSGLYRPLLLASLSLDSRMFEAWLPGYHLSNILLHVIVTLLVFGLVLRLLQMASRPTDRAAARPELYAVLAALVFAAHPVHTEVVNSVFNRSDMLVSLGVAAGLWWLLHFLEPHPARAWVGLGIAYLLALLSKENAVVLPALAVALILLLRTESWKHRIRRSLPVLWMLLPLALYLYLRANALAPAGADTADGMSRFSDLVGEARFIGMESLLALVGNAGIGLKLMVWPHPLQTNYPVPSTTSALAFGIAQLGLIGAGMAQLRNGRSALLAGLAWFYLALLPASRIIAVGDGGPHLAERYLYLPSAGMAIALAFALAWLGARFGPRRPLILVFLALLVMLPLTWVRNNEWGSDLRLFEAEYRRSGPYPDTLRYLTGAHFARGNFARGAEICDRHTDLFPGHTSYARHCGMLYAQLGRSDDSERAYLQGIEAGDDPAVNTDLGLLYLSQGRRMDAALQLQRAIDLEVQPAIKLLRQGFQLAYLFPADAESVAKARDYFAEAYRMEPLLKVADTWAKRMDEALAEITAKEEPAPSQ